MKNALRQLIFHHYMHFTLTEIRSSKLFYNSNDINTRNIFVFKYTVLIKSFVKQFVLNTDCSCHFFLLHLVYLMS